VSNPTAEKILEVLATVAETDEVQKNPDLALYELQVLDSLKTPMLILELEREMGVSVPPADFDRDAWATPRKLVEDVQRRLAS
jgi:D-alanine--poly(phosphoribitol) ligase subunit 2